MPEHDPQFDECLNAYLDDSLSQEDRAGFEAKLQSDPELRAAVDLQRRIDDSLARSFATPDPDTVETPAMAAAPAQLRPGLPWRRWLVAAVVIVVGTLSIVYFVERLTAPGPGTGSRALTETLVQTYQRMVGAGFEPGWVCANDQEFKDSFRLRVDRPMLLRALPSDVEAIGLAYSIRTMSPHTIMLLARVDGAPVLVFVDKQANDPGDLAVEAPGIHIYRRTLEDLVLYEVSKLPEPHVFDYLYIPR